MSSKPLIGINCDFNYEKNNSYLDVGYYKAIMMAGGVPVAIPAMEDCAVLDEFIEKMDGILLIGGPDIEPSLYGEAALPFNGRISPIRDIVDIYLAKKAVELNKPLLGICRGCQAINVAFGGTLYQDIPSQVKDRQVLKHAQETPFWYPIHNIYIENGSKVCSWFSSNPARVNSLHHQAVKDVAKGFSVVAKAEDGIVEAIAHNSRKFVVGVQWHPELMWEKNYEILTMFKDFVQCCGESGI